MGGGGAPLGLKCPNDGDTTSDGVRVWMTGGPGGGDMGWPAGGGGWKLGGDG